MVNLELLNRPLVTGACGYIGRNLVKTLVQMPSVETVFAIDMPTESNRDLYKEMPNVTFIGCDLQNSDSFKNSKPNLITSVFALAAMNGTSRFYREPWNVFMNSLLPTLTVLDSVDMNVPIVYSSSSEVYASSIDLGIGSLPTSEDVPLSIYDVKNPRWSYATAKLAGEVALFASARQFGRKGSIVRYHNVYGPQMEGDHFVPDFIERVRNHKFWISGARNTRSFLYIDDAVEGTIKALFKASPEVPTYHLGTNEELTIEEAASIIMNIMGENSSLEFRDAPTGSVLRRQPDCSKAKAELNWEPRIDFYAGITKVLSQDQTSN